MKFLSWSLTLSFLIFVTVESVAFHRATVCRQEAWRLSFNLKVLSTLSKKSPKIQAHKSCQLFLKETSGIVYWRRLPSLKSHAFSLPLNGRL